MPPTGIPARLKKLEARVADIEDLLTADDRRADQVLAEAKRVLRIALRSPKRLAQLEDAVAALEARARR